MGGNEKKEEGRSGGINFTGGDTRIQGDVAGGDLNKNVYGNVTYGAIPAEKLEALLKPLIELVDSTAEPAKSEATTNVNELKEELGKGADADDGTLAKLVDGLIRLVPTAVAAVVGAFASPVLAGVAGPVTKAVLEKLHGDEASR